MQVPFLNVNYIFDQVRVRKKLKTNPLEIELANQPLRKSRKLKSPANISDLYINFKIRSSEFVVVCYVAQLANASVQYA